MGIIIVMTIRTMGVIYFLQYYVLETHLSFLVEKMWVVVMEIVQYFPKDH